MSRNGRSGLPIAEVAERTGLTIATLRAWEQRHGFPTPARLEGGHRRYSEDELRRIEAVLAARASGLSLDAAIERVSAIADATIFAALRRLRPELTPQLLGRHTMLALSHAIEDECLARGDRAHVTAAFQRAALYRRAKQRRWRTMTRTASSTVIFADFARSRQPSPNVWEVAIADGAPLEREWSVVCDGPTSAAVLAGWERADGRFEAVWTVEPAAVRLATDVGRRLAGLPAVDAAIGSASDDALRRAVAITNRVVGYLDT